MNAYETPTGCLQLTNAADNQRGAAWAECPMNLEAPFDLSFTINAGTMNGGEMACVLSCTKRETQGLG